MKRSVVLLSLVLLVAVSATACAATYQRRLPGLEGYYSRTEALRSASFDFGSAFTSISSISLRIIGQATDSQDWTWMPDPMNPTGPPILNIIRMPVAFTAGIPTADQGFYGMAAMGFFDMPVSTTGTTDSVLRDGFGNVELYSFIPYTNGPAGFATVEQAYVVVDGEMPVPEPSSLIALAGGLLSLGGLARRRK